MPSYIFITPLASTYINQFSAQPQTGEICVPVIRSDAIELHPEHIQSEPLSSAVEMKGEGYVAYLKEHLQLLKWTGKSVSVVSSVMTGVSGWRAIIGAADCLPASFVLNRRDLSSSDRSSPRMTVVSLRGEDSRARYADQCLEIGIDHHSEQTKARMAQSLIRHKKNALVTPPAYTLNFESLAMNGLRRLLGLPEIASMLEVGKALFRSLGLGRPSEIVTPRPQRFMGDMASPPSFRIRGSGLDRDIVIQGDFEFQNPQDGPTAYEEWLRVDVLPTDPQHAALTESEMELWDLPESGLYPVEPSNEEREEYRRLAARIYAGIRSS